MTTLPEKEWIRCTVVRRKINKLVCEQGMTEKEAVEYIKQHEGTESN